MCDSGYFLLLAVSLACALAVPFAAKGIVRGNGGAASPLAMAIGCVVGTISAMPFGSTREMPWFPEVAVGYFGIAVTATVLLGISRAISMVREISEKPAKTGDE